MNTMDHNLSAKACHALLAEIEPGSTFISIRPMGAAGTHPAYVLEARTSAGADLRLAIKCYRSDLGSAAARARLEYKTLALLQKHDVPVPVPVYLDEQGTLLGASSIVTTFVEGKQIFTCPDGRACARALAQVLVKIHSVPVGAVEKEFLEDANRGVLWFRKTGVMPDYMANHPSGPLVWDAIEKLLPTQQPVPPAFVHTDYWIGQVLWDHGRISAVLDWEEAGYGDPAYDLAYCRMDMYLSHMGRAAADELQQVYEAEMGRPTANLGLWEFAVMPRPMHNPEWEAVCRPELRDFMADVRKRTGF